MFCAVNAMSDLLLSLAVILADLNAQQGENLPISSFSAITSLFTINFFSLNTTHALSVWVKKLFNMQPSALPIPIPECQ
jgi:hypothetical protein